MSTDRYYSLATYFRHRFGHRVRKIPLDAGSTCPNRDGTLSVRGCSFCNQRGSGSDLAKLGLTLTQQYLRQRDTLRIRRPDAKFMAYIQSFSNTYGPIARLRRMLDELSDLPDLVGLAIGTRPDCLDDAKLTLLREAPIAELWLDLGLQSMHATTLRRINRGHDAATFATWTERAAALGLRVCAHVIVGLPGETEADFKQTISFVNRLPVAGIKIHNLYVCTGTSLEEEWLRGEITLLNRMEALHWTAHGLATLRPDIVIHRLNGDPAQDELVAPDWTAHKTAYLNDLNQLLRAENIWQGKDLGCPPESKHLPTIGASHDNRY